MSVNLLHSSKDDNHRVVHGDWQTPPELAALVCRLCHSLINPATIVEPNCGQGAFLASALNEFPESRRIWGGDINPTYIRQINPSSRLTVERADFFEGAWRKIIQRSEGEILVIGNPPWVTNSELARRGSNNLPAKNNDGRLSGIDAITGKSNFDISQWMIQEEIRELQGRNAILAMLCKTSAARKILEHCWKIGLKFSDFQIRLFDAKRYFNVAVDASLLLVRFLPSKDRSQTTGVVYDSPEIKGKPIQKIGCFRGIPVQNIEIVEEYSDLLTESAPFFTWRSGIKHDCSKIMEFSLVSQDNYRNGLGETVSLESDCLYPLMKSSDLANGHVEKVERVLLVTQTKVGQETTPLKNRFPKTWSYLYHHKGYFQRRKSSIYRDKPPFSIFGVGDYTFFPWKVAISGLYKRLAFQSVGPLNKRPIVFDDTCYLLSFKTERQAVFTREILESTVCQALFNAFIFWDAKRPITGSVLNRVNLAEVARRTGQQERFSVLFPDYQFSRQKRLFSDDFTT